MESDLLLRDFRPRPEAVVQCTAIDRPRFEVVDAHNHLGELMPGLSFSGSWPRRPISQLLDVMDEAGVRAVIDLDGQWGDKLKREIDRYQMPHPDRFAVFAGLDYSQFSQAGFGEKLYRNLREAAAAGARGLKVWKPLGLSVRDPAGNLIAPDDARLADLWEAAGELKLPVLIHIADPVAFFRPLDATNERWEEMHAHPEWCFNTPGFPSFEQLIDQFAGLVCRHPHTQFIGAHVGCYAENLAWVSGLLDRCPNFHIDISARLGELGRAPYSARALFERHAGRILFGVDSPPNVRVYRLYYRFLETQDENFAYWIGDRPPQGRWMIHGLGLPDEVLRKVYSENARRLIRFG